MTHEHEVMEPEAERAIRTLEIRSIDPDGGGHHFACSIRHVSQSALEVGVNPGGPLGRGWARIRATESPAVRDPATVFPLAAPASPDRLPGFSTVSARPKANQAVAAVEKQLPAARSISHGPEASLRQLLQDNSR